MGGIRCSLVEEVDVLRRKSYDFHLELTVLRKTIKLIEKHPDTENRGVKIPEPKLSNGIQNANELETLFEIWNNTLRQSISPTWKRYP